MSALRDFAIYAQTLQPTGSDKSSSPGAAAAWPFAAPALKSDAEPGSFDGTGRGDDDDAPLNTTPVNEALTVKAPNPGSGGETHDASSITFSPAGAVVINGSTAATGDFRGGQTASVDVEAGTSGQVVLYVKIEGFQDNVAINEHFTQDFTVTWDFAAADDGTLTIDTPQEKWGAPSTGTYYRLDSVNPGNGKASVQVSPIIAGAADAGSLSPAGVGVSQQSQPPKIRETFRLNINVKVREPKGTVTVGDEVTTIGKFDYTVGPFKRGSATALDSGSITKQVYDILNQMLPEETREQIFNGKMDGGEKIEVHGYASNTDSQQRNFELSKQRAKAVLAAFQSLGAPGNLFTAPIPHGEWESNPTDDKKEEKEDPDWRKVVLKIQSEMTFKIDPKTGEAHRIK